MSRAFVLVGALAFVCVIGASHGDAAVPLSAQDLAASLDLATLGIPPSQANFEGSDYTLWRLLRGTGAPNVDSRDDAVFDRLEYPFLYGAKAYREEVNALGLQTVVEQRGGYNYGCSFEGPLQMLRERAATLGKSHPYLRDWIANQDQVFAVCSNPDDKKGSPEDLTIRHYTQAIDALAKSDRAYQRAAIAFYRRNPDAIRQFKALAADRTWPDRALARFMEARALVDLGKSVSAMLADIDQLLADPAFASVHRIARQLIAAAAEQTYPEHDPGRAQAMAAVARDLAVELDKPAGEINASQTATDDWVKAVYSLPYFWSQDTAGSAARAGIDLAADKFETIDWLRAMQRSHRFDEHYRWILTLEGWPGVPEDTGRGGDAVYRYRATEDVAWLIPALAGIRPDDYDAEPIAQGFLDLHRRVLTGEASVRERIAYRAMFRSGIRLLATMYRQKPRDPESAVLDVQPHPVLPTNDAVLDVLNDMATLPSVAWRDTAVIGEARLLLAMGAYDHARTLLATFSNVHQAYLPSSYYHYDVNEGDADELRLLLVRDPAEAYRTEAAVDAQWPKLAPLLKTMLDAMPLAVLEQALASPDLNTRLKPELARVAWMRALLLEHETALERLTPEVRDLNPEIRADIESATGRSWLVPRSQRIAAFLLKYPRFSPHLKSEIGGTLSAIDRENHNDDNWWCTVDANRKINAINEAFDEVLGFPSDWARLNPWYGGKPTTARKLFFKQSPLIALIDRHELYALGAAPSGPQMLGTEIIDRTRNIGWFGQLFGADQDLPEALHDTVVATRFGCIRDGSNGPVSHQAFTLLHARYGSTDWARQTPYWFDVAAW